jgi:hypothetical protein
VEAVNYWRSFQLLDPSASDIYNVVNIQTVSLVSTLDPAFRPDNPFLFYTREFTKTARECRSNNLEKPTACANHPYKIHLFSEDPLVIYIDSFISKDEASQLVSMR